MKFTWPFSKRNLPWCTLCQWSVLVLLAISILWRGGKSLDMTWILTGIACIAVIIAHTFDRETGDRPVPRVLWGAVMGFIVLTIASYATSQTANYGLDELLRTGALGLFFLWTLRTINQKDNGSTFLNRLLGTLCITTLIACSIGLLVYILQPVNRAVGTFFDYRFHTDYWPNAWANYVLLVWPLVLYALFTGFRFEKANVRSRMEFLVRIALFSVVLASVHLSFSRGGVLVFLMQLSLWTGLIYYKTRQSFSLKSMVPTLVLTAALTTVIVLVANGLRSQFYEVQKVEEKITLTAAEGTSSVSERTQFWSQSLQLGVQKPLLGWGPYSFRFVQPQLQSGILETSDHPHNVLLKLFMERGVFALGFFVLLIGIVLYKSATVLLSDRTDVQSSMFSFPVLIFLGVFGALLHNMIDFNLQFVGIALPFWMLLGILAADDRYSALRAVPVHIARWCEMFIAIILLIVAVYEGSFLIISSLGRHAEASGKTQAALYWYAKTDGEFFTRDLQLSKAKLLLEADEIGEAQITLDAYEVRNTQDYRSWKRQGDIARMKDQKQLALQEYERSFERGKYNDLSILDGLLESYIALDQQEEIEKQRLMIDDLLNQYADAIQRNVHHIALSSNVEYFVSVCNILARLFPDDAPRYQVMAAKADHHAQIERQRIASRPPGFLW